MKIGMVSNAIYNIDPPYICHTDNIKRTYCSKWGIDYLRTNQNPHPELHPVWCKPKVLMQYLDKYDWLVWVDMDAAPVGMHFNIEEFLSSVGDRCVMIKDINGWNNGVFAFPCSANGKAWIEDIESHCHDLVYQRRFREQQCMSDSFDREWSEFVYQPPKEIGWNSYPDVYAYANRWNPYRDGHFMLHLPGVKDKSMIAMAFAKFERELK